LDGASEAALRVALRSTVLKRGAAMLTVAHRLSTAREAHRVVVLDPAASLKMARRRT
jgi:ABC-type multidrug transport system fused ATPase/permease subunit